MFERPVSGRKQSLAVSRRPRLLRQALSPPRPEPTPEQRGPRFPGHVRPVDNAPEAAPTGLAQFGGSGVGLSGAATPYRGHAAP
jgi:hypothetical protein